MSHIRVVVVISLAFVAGAATAQDKSVAIQLPPEVAANCKAEGGCTLWSESKLRATLTEIWLDGQRSGFLKGRKEAEDKQRTLTCTRG